MVTGKISGRINLMSTHGHGVVVTEFVLAEGTTRDDTFHLKPVTWGGNLSIVGAE